MEKVFVKVLALLNKPIHYFLVGICLIIWNRFIEKEPKYILLIGIILLLLSIASFIEFIIRKICAHNRKNKIKKQKNESEKKEQEQLKSNINSIIEEYNNLKGKEKEIIDYCLKNNTRAFQPKASVYSGYPEAIMSLIAKGFAQKGSNFAMFTMNHFAYKTLTKIKEVKNAK